MKHVVEFFRLVPGIPIELMIGLIAVLAICLAIFAIFVVFRIVTRDGSK